MQKLKCTCVCEYFTYGRAVHGIFLYMLRCSCVSRVQQLASRTTCMHMCRSCRDGA